MKDVHPEMSQKDLNPHKPLIQLDLSTKATANNAEYLQDLLIKSKDPQAEF